MPDSSPDPVRKNNNPSPDRRVLVAGATGYIGRHLCRELCARGFSVVALVRRQRGGAGAMPAELDGCEIRYGDVCDTRSVRADGFADETFDAVFSCLSTRHGGIEDAWAVDYRANLNLLEAAEGSATPQFILLSALCVQKPLLAFQKAKLAFEKELADSGLRYSIVRPTAFFKSLSGQIDRVKSGKPFMVFGDGELTACKPIAESDLAGFLADCLDDPDKQNAILPIGGPGPAVSPREQGELLFRLTGQPARFRRIPVSMFSLAAGVLDALGIVFPKLRDKAEFARIGRYYATESMLCFDPQTGRYDADATPSSGTVTLEDFYTAALKSGLAGQELGEHALFVSKRTHTPNDKSELSDDAREP